MLDILFTFAILHSSNSETQRRNEMDKQLKQGLTIDARVPAYGFAMGETIYTVCDAIGVIFTTIYPSQLEQFYVEAA